MKILVTEKLAQLWEKAGLAPLWKEQKSQSVDTHGSQNVTSDPPVAGTVLDVGDNFVQSIPQVTVADHMLAAANEEWHQQHADEPVGVVDTLMDQAKSHE